MTDQEHDGTIRHRFCDARELLVVDIDLRIVVALAGSSIDRIHHVERERSLGRRHLPQIACRLLGHGVHRTIALLCGILDEVLEVGVCENVALEYARHFVPCTAYDAFRALQRDQSLVDDELRQIVFVDSRVGLPFAQFVERSAATGNVREPVRRILRYCPPTNLAGLCYASVEEVLQGAAATRARRRQPCDTQGLHPDVVVAPRQGSQHIAGASLREPDK